MQRKSFLEPVEDDADQEYDALPARRRDEERSGFRKTIEARAPLGVERRTFVNVRPEGRNRKPNWHPTTLAILAIAQRSLSKFVVPYLQRLVSNILIAQLYVKLWCVTPALRTFIIANRVIQYDQLRRSAEGCGRSLGWQSDLSTSVQFPLRSITVAWVFPKNSLTKSWTCFTTTFEPSKRVR